MQKIAENAKAIARAEGFERQENRVSSPSKLKSKGSHARNGLKSLGGRSVNNLVLIKPQSAMAIEIQKYYKRGQDQGKALGF